MMKRIYTLGILCLLYGLNKFFLIPAMGSIAETMQWADIMHRVFSNYGADILAGAWILCFLNILLCLAGRKTVEKMRHAVLFLLACGIFWEYVTPLYLERTVSDPWDIVAYIFGGIILFLMEKTINRQKE